MPGSANQIYICCTGCSLSSEIKETLSSISMWFLGKCHITSTGTAIPPAIPPWTAIPPALPTTIIPLIGPILLLGVVDQPQDQKGTTDNPHFVQPALMALNDVKVARCLGWCHKIIRRLIRHIRNICFWAYGKHEVLVLICAGNFGRVIKPNPSSTNLKSNEN